MVSPKNPSKYRGTDVSLANIVVRDREPTLADYRQPETGKNYVIGCVWQVGKNPTTGVEGDMWMLTKIVANEGYWMNISSGGQNVDTFEVDAFTAPGTNPVTPDGTGLVTVTGGQVAASTTPNVIRTDSLAANTMTIQVQRSQAVAGSTVGANGVSHFDSGSFNVDANAFVTLKGGSAAIDSVGVDAATGPGTNPVLPDANGLITVTGGQVASGTTANVIRSNSLAANAYTVQVQRAGSAASTTAALNGVCHFDNHDFVVDANAYVSLAVAPTGFSEIVMQTFTSTGTYTPTAGMVYCIVEIVGGGGGGGGARDDTGGTIAAGGGGSGGYVKGVYSAATIGASQAVTIGALGAGGVLSASGAAGGTTTFGALMTAGGGGGGAGSIYTGGIALGGAGGTASGGTNAFVGNAGGFAPGTHTVGDVFMGGYGAASFFGGSPIPVISANVSSGTNGNPATTYGAGGGGAVGYSTNGATGGNGFAGICIVTEYCS